MKVDFVSPAFLFELSAVLRKSDAQETKRDTERNTDTQADRHTSRRVVYVVCVCVCVCVCVIVYMYEATHLHRQVPPPTA